MKNRACSEPCWLKIDSTTYSRDLNQSRVSCRAGFEVWPRSSTLVMGWASGSFCFAFALSLTLWRIDEGETGAKRYGDSQSSSGISNQYSVFSVQYSVFSELIALSPRFCMGSLN